MIYLICFLLWLLGTWLIARFVLSGSDHSQFDSDLSAPHIQLFEDSPEDAKVGAQFLSKINAVRDSAEKTRSLKKGLAMVREFADNLSADLVSDCEFTSVNINGLKAEWTIAPGVDTKRRVLFCHGGAFAIGSPKGHRAFSHELSHMANAAVLSIDYGLMPENGRMKSIKDAQAAYRWILDQGPSGNSPLEFFLVAGDSAGGNLALMLSSWSGQQGLRRPDGVIGFSPSLDMTAQSPTVRSNLKTDPILGRAFSLILTIPYMFAAWLQLFIMRMNTASALASPLFFELNDLPKTLIHASSSEILLGESVRYVNKARSQGSDVSLQVWKNQLHDWHLFNRGHGSANAAWAKVQEFIDSLPSKN